MSKTYDQLNNDIGQILFNIAPDRAKIIIMKAELSQEGDHCQCQFDYINESNDIKRFLGGARANYDMLNCLVELRKYCIDNNLTNGLPAWVGCIVTVDIEKATIDIEFKYEPFIAEQFYSLTS